MYPVGRAGAEGAGPTRELLAISEQARGRWGKPPIGVSHSAHLAEHRADLWKVLALLSSEAASTWSPQPTVSPGMSRTLPTTPEQV